jgi:hypothetical protein
MTITNRLSDICQYVLKRRGLQKEFGNLPGSIR